MTKRIFFIISSLVLIGALLSACGGAPATATPTAEAAPVKTASLSTAAEGNLEPVQSVTLNFTGSGLVTEVNVKEGQTVEAGDIIARVKSDAQRNVLAEAEAALATAQSRSSRVSIAAAAAHRRGRSRNQSGPSAASGGCRGARSTGRDRRSRSRSGTGALRAAAGSNGSQYPVRIRQDQRRHVRACEAGLRECCQSHAGCRSTPEGAKVRLAQRSRYRRAD